MTTSIWKRPVHGQEVFSCEPGFHGVRPSSVRSWNHPVVRPLLLAHDEPINQRELTRTLEIERATLSAVISALVRKGFVEQISDPDDQRQKVLQLTPAAGTYGRRFPILLG